MRFNYQLRSMPITGDNVMETSYFELDLGKKKYNQIGSPQTCLFMGQSLVTS